MEELQCHEERDKRKLFAETPGFCLVVKVSIFGFRTVISEIPSSPTPNPKHLTAKNIESGIC
jgi:hypothetical protein